MTPYPQEVLFTLNIPAHQSSASPSSGGTIVVSKLVTTGRRPAAAEPSAAQSISSDPRTGKARPRHDIPPTPPIYLLTFTSPADNRLTPSFATTFLTALLRLQHGGYAYGILMTTSGIPKFYSNGLDLATFRAGDLVRYIFPLWRKLLTFPMVTVAVINGHCFAGGFLTAMCHDYRVQNAHRGWLAMNELEFDAELAPAMSMIFKAKVANSTFRSVLLEARRFTSLQALEAGLVDGVGDLDAAVAMMTDDEHGRGAMVVASRGNKTVYGKMKEDMYQNVVDALKLSEQDGAQFSAARQAERDMDERGEVLALQQLSKLEKAKL